MQESSDFSQASPSQKRLKIIEAAMAEGGSSDHSGPSITSPVHDARNMSPLQPSPLGNQPFFLVIMFLIVCHSRVKFQSCARISSDTNEARRNARYSFFPGTF